MILGDDDRHLTERERPLPNAGREAATEAAKAVGGIAAFPAFKQGPNAERTDFNDLQKTEGLKTVEIQLAHVAAIARQKHLNRQQAKEKDKARQDQQEEISL